MQEIYESFLIAFQSEKLRKKFVKKIEKNSEEYQKFIDDNINDYDQAHSIVQMITLSDGIYIVKSSKNFKAIVDFSIEFLNTEQFDDNTKLISTALYYMYEDESDIDYLNENKNKYDRVNDYLNVLKELEDKLKK